MIDLERFFNLDEISEFREEVVKSIQPCNRHIRAFNEEGNFFVKGATRSRKTSTILKLSAFKAYTQKNNVVIVTRTKRQIDGVREVLHQYTPLPDNSYYELVLQSKSESCLRISNPNLGHSECSLQMNNHKRKRIIELFPKGPRDLDLIGFNVDLDLEDICIPSAQEYLAENSGEFRDPFFIFLTWEKLRHIYEEEHQLFSTLMRDNLVIADEFPASTTLTRLDDKSFTVKDIQENSEYTGLESEELSVNLLESYIEDQIFYLNHEISQNKLKQVSDYLNLRLRKAYQEYENSVKYPDEKRFKKSTLPSLDEEVKEAFARAFSDTSTSSDLTKNMQLLNMAIDDKTEIGYDFMLSKGNLKLNLNIYRSMDDTEIESRKAITEMTVEPYQTYLISATPPRKEIKGEKYLLHYYNPLIEEYTDVKFPPRYNHTLIACDGGQTLTNIYQNSEDRERFLDFMKKLVTKLKIRGVSYKIFCRSKREKKMLEEAGIPHDNLTYARSDESEGVNTDEELIILTGPPFVHPGAGRWRKKSIDFYTDLGMNGDQSLRSYWATSEMIQVIGRNMVREDSKAVILNAGSLRNRPHWSWLDEINYYSQPISEKSTGNKLKLLLKSIEAKEKITVGDIIKEEIKRILAERDEIGKKELLQEELNIGSLSDRKEILGQLVSESKNIREKKRKMKRNKKKFIESDFSKGPLPSPPSSFLPSFH